jgi:hypothetical protein
VKEDPLRGRPPLRLPTADAGGLRLESGLLDESSPFGAVRASCPAVQVPDDEVSRLVADDFPPITTAESSDGGVELDHAVLDRQSSNRGCEASVESNLKV